MSNEKLESAKQTFINQWGTLSSAWGVNRTFAQIQALLMASDRPLNTDEIMEKLSISRGNAHQNLKDMISWGLVKVELKPGDRKEYFAAEKEPWKLFTVIAKERRRREINPTLEILLSCIEQTEDIKSEEAKEFTEMISSLADLLKTGAGILDKLTASKNGLILNLLIKALK